MPGFGEQHRRHGHGVVPGDLPGFVNIVENGKQAVIFFLRNRVVLVIVAAGAFHRQAQKGCAERVGAVGDVFHPEFLVDDAPLHVLGMVAVEGRRDALVTGRRGQQIARQLPSHELVVGPVLVESPDHPVAVGPHGPVAIDGVAVRIGKAGQVHPVHGHFFAVVRRTEQAVNYRFVRAGRGVGPERRRFFGRGRQAGQIQAHAAQQGFPVRFGGGSQPGVFQTFQHKKVNAVAGPGRVSNLGNGLRLGFGQCPVRLVFGPLLDPAQQHGFFVGRQIAVGVGRGHHFIGIGVDQPEVHFASGQMPRHDGVFAAFQRGPGPFRRGEFEAAFLTFLVGTVAEKALVGKNRLDVPVEVNFTGQLRFNGKHVRRFVHAATLV